MLKFPNLSGYSPHLTTGSVLDILLVSFLIYQFLLLVRGTRAVPMLTGVGALVIAFYIAHLSNLRTLDWLVGTILPYSIFALIVIFQTEIRQALARLGRNLTLARGSQNGTADAYDDIVMAATTFSQDQTGALVVIEREIGLRTYIESGVAARRPSLLRSAGDSVPSQRAPARWRRHSAEGSHRRRRLLPASLHESAALHPARHPPSRRNRNHRRDRRGLGDRLGGDRRHQHRRRRTGRARHHPRTAASAPG